jgi:hypothetical protein
MVIPLTAFGRPSGVDDPVIRRFLETFSLATNLWVGVGLEIGSATGKLQATFVTTITSATSGNFMRYDGSVWLNVPLSASHVTTGTFADARISESSVTQHEAELTITESQISDLIHATATLGAIGDVTITAIASGEIPKWNGAAWINNTLAEAGIAATSHVHAASAITSGTITDARIAASNVTQHKVAVVTDVAMLNFSAHTELTILSGAVTVTQSWHELDTEADASTDDLVTINGGTEGDVVYLNAINNTRTVVIKHGTGNIECQSGEDIILDFSKDRVELLYDGANWMATSTNVLSSLGTLNDVTITTIASGEMLKWDGSGWINNTLAEAGIAATGHVHAASNTTSGTFADARISESSVTQHQDAMTTSIGMLNIGSPVELTIATGEVTVTQSFHQLDTEADASTDDLDTISGGTDGDVLFLNAISNTRTVVIKHNTGNIQTRDGADITLGLFRQRITLLFTSSNWYVQSAT